MLFDHHMIHQRKLEMRNNIVTLKIIISKNDVISRICKFVVNVFIIFFVIFLLLFFFINEQFLDLLISTFVYWFIIVILIVVIRKNFNIKGLIVFTETSIELFSETIIHIMDIEIIEITINGYRWQIETSGSVLMINNGIDNYIDIKEKGKTLKRYYFYIKNKRELRELLNYFQSKTFINIKKKSDRL